MSSTPPPGQPRRKAQFVKPVEEEAIQPARPSKSSKPPRVEPVEESVTAAKPKAIKPAKVEEKPKRSPQDEELYRYTKLLLDKGMPPKKVHQKLVEFKQVDSKEAARIVKGVLAENTDKEKDKDYFDLAERLLDGGMRPKAVWRKLVEEEGVDEDEADRIMDELLPPEEEDEPRKKKKKKKKASSGSSEMGSTTSALVSMAIGGGLCILGIVVTVVTYNSAASGGNGGKYFIAYGPVIFGGILFVKGLIQLF